MEQKKFVTLPLEVVENALAALENTSPLGFNMESDKKFYAAITDLRTAIQQSNPFLESDNLLKDAYYAMIAKKNIVKENMYD